MKWISADFRIPSNCGLSKQDRFASLYSPPIPAVDGPRTSHLLNSGLVILKPSQDTMCRLEHYLNTSPLVADARFADQDVLATFFQGRWRPLPWWTNGLKTQRAVHSDVWLDTEVRLIHYM